MIELKNVSVIFGKNTPLENEALRKINLTIETGDFITLIGGNGAGKSTLLGALSGEVIPSHGKIFLEQADISKQSVETRSAYIGHVYQDPRLGTCDVLTVEENLAFAFMRGKRRGLGMALTSAMRAQFKDLLAELHLGLETRLSDRVAMLSGGQRQALSLVMATMHAPKLLLLDEHTAALDPKTASIILALTHEIVTQHKLTTLMVTHNMHQALEMGNRTLLMQEGKISQDLKADERRRLKPENLIAFF